MDVIVTCPACGGTDFEERNTLSCTAQLAGFRLVGGTLIVDYSGSTDVDWNSQRAVPRKPLSCQSCDARFDPADLVATATPESSVTA